MRFLATLCPWEVSGYKWSSLSSATASAREREREERNKSGQRWKEKKDRELYDESAIGLCTNHSPELRAHKH